MKLRKIYESILTEIGDSIEKPSGGIYIIDSETTGLVKFEWLNDEYGIGIHLPVFQENEDSTRIAIITYFDVIGGTFRLTDKNQPLKLMGFIVGSLVEWMSRWKKKFSKNNKVELVYIKYDPKSESDEKFDDSGNKRDRLYRIFIEKFAKKYNSSVSFSTVGGVTAIFKPPIEIK